MTDEDSGVSFCISDLYNAFRCGIYTLDSGRQILDWNSAAERISGYPAEEVVGQCCADNILRHVDPAGSSLCKCSCPIALSFSDGKARENQVLLHHRDGFRVPVTVRCNVLRDSIGNITGGLECFSDTPFISSLRKLQPALEQKGYLDPLTKLPAASLLNSHLDRLLSDHGRANWPFVYYQANLDHFKEIVNRHGSAAADKALRMAAQTILHSMNAFDFIARLENDTFAGILFNADATLARNILNRQRTIVEQSFIKVEGEVIAITCSFGGVPAGFGTPPQALREQAMAALKESKARGRNRVTVLGCSVC